MFYPGVKPLDTSWEKIKKMSTHSLRKPKNKVEEEAVEVRKGKGKKVSVVVEEQPTAESESENEPGSDFESENESECESNDTETEKEGIVDKNKKTKSESRQEAKKVKLERQAHRPHNDLVQNSKRLWEKVRRRDLSSAERAGPLAELFSLLTGKFKEVIVKHDASRLIQTCVKYGNSEQRLQIATELKGDYADIAKSRYGKHIVKRLLQYCPSVRKSIVSEFRGQVGKLIRHVDASAAGTSKKDAHLRSSELRSDLIEPLTDLMISSSELEGGSPYSLENLLSEVSGHVLLLEASLALPVVCEKLLTGPACELKNYESADFRALMKKWSRKCSVAQGQSFFSSTKGILPKLVESEAAYILAVLVTSKPELKGFIEKNPKSKNEHAIALYQKL